MIRKRKKNFDICYVGSYSSTQKRSYFYYLIKDQMYIKYMKKDILQKLVKLFGLNNL